MSKLNTLADFFPNEIKDTYSDEKQILYEIPVMVKVASTAELRKALEKHLDETRNQIINLEEMSRNIEKYLPSKRCKAMESFAEEAKENLEKDAESRIKDVNTKTLEERNNFHKY